jgi:hypothetical protein
MYNASRFCPPRHNQTKPDTTTNDQTQPDTTRQKVGRKRHNIGRKQAQQDKNSLGFLMKEEKRHKQAHIGTTG